MNGINLYNYCNDNPINYKDENGNIAGLVITLGLLIGGAIAGGAIAGKKSYDNGNRGWSLAKDIILGSSLGLAAAGVGIALFAVGLGAFSVSTFLGLTTAQLFAIGALAVDFTAFIIAPIFGFQMQGLEFEKKYSDKYETNPIPSYPTIEGIGFKSLNYSSKVLNMNGVNKWIIKYILNLKVN